MDGVVERLVDVIQLSEAEKALQRKLCKHTPSVSIFELFVLVGGENLISGVIEVLRLSECTIPV